MFTHDLIVPGYSVSNEDTDHGRYYVTPSGARYPSVTTVLGRFTGTAWKDDWIKRVGQDKADKVSRQATRRGRVVHDMAERFLRNDPDWAKDAMPSTVYTFQPLVEMLPRRVGRILGIEHPLWSDTLQTAGRSDLIAEWDGVLAVVDFKTSKSDNPEWLAKKTWQYMVQKAAYARMFEERTGISIPRLVTVIPADHAVGPEVWVQGRTEYDEDVDRVYLDRLFDPGLRLPSQAA